MAPLEQPPAGAPAGVKCFQATFKPAIKKGTSQEFDVVATITGVFKANPAKIEQTDKQYVEYRDNLYLLSPYTVESQTTVVSEPCRQQQLQQWWQQQSVGVLGVRPAAAV